jgi:hypothetical protein
LIGIANLILYRLKTDHFAGSTQPNLLIYIYSNADNSNTCLDLTQVYDRNSGLRSAAILSG